VSDISNVETQLQEAAVGKLILARGPVGSKTWGLHLTMKDSSQNSAGGSSRGTDPEKWAQRSNAQIGRCAGSREKNPDLIGGLAAGKLTDEENQQAQER
jgi:hypothetical protein